MKICLYARNTNQDILFNKIAKILETLSHDVHLFSPRKGVQEGKRYYPEETASNIFDEKNINFTAEFKRICNKYENINRIIQSDRELNYFPEYFGDGPIDREVKLKFLVAFFLTFEKYIECEKPNLIISEMVLGLMDGAFYEVCKSNGIPFIGIRPSKTSKGIVFCDNPYDSPVGLFKRMNEISGSDDAVILKAEKLTDSAVKKDADPHYMIRSAKKYKLLSLRAINAIYKLVVNDVIFPKNTIYQKKKINAVREFIHRKKNIHGWKFEGNVDIDSYCESYFVYAAHFEPEASVQVRAYEFSDQLALIKLISRLLPPSSLLFLKEHKGNQGFRKTNFYQQISHLHNVKILNPRINLRNFIKDSNGVITLTGRIGLEALIDGVPVIAFGETFWTNIKKVYKPRSIDDIKTVLYGLSKNKYENHSEAPKSSSHIDLELAKLIIAYEDSVYPGTFIQGEMAFTSNENANDYANAILDFSSKYL